MEGWQRVSWAEFKAQRDARLLPIQEIKHYAEDGTTLLTYHLRLIDEGFNIETFVHADGNMPTELTDYVDNYQEYANKSPEPRDKDGAKIQRVKAAKAGWTYQLHTVGIKTGALTDSLFNKKVDPVTLEITDLGFATIKLYDSNRDEITDDANKANAHYTVVDWTVDHEMEIIGALFTQTAAPASDVWMWAYGAPGIANVGFCEGGCNLKRLGDGNEVNADGRAAKYFHPTEPIPGVNTMRIIFYHPTHVEHECQMIFDLFKP